MVKTHIHILAPVAAVIEVSEKKYQNDISREINCKVMLSH
jgi:hypothetical protein